MDTVVVELIMHGKQVEYCEVGWTEARDILARPMAPGCHWRIPEWQFSGEDGTEGEHTLRAQKAAYEAVRGAKVAG